MSYPCAYSLSATSQTIGSAGGGGSVGLTTAADCAWTATSNDAWITVNVGSTSGTGPATVSFTRCGESERVEPHGLAHDRRPDLHRHAGGRRLPVRRLANQRAVQLQRRKRSDGDRHDSGRLRLDGNEQRRVDHDHRTGATGSGNGTVTYNIASQSSAHVSRTGTMTIAGQTVTITQEGLAAQFIIADQ